MKINLGCGSLKKNGYLNVDKSSEYHPDIIADITNTPWKWVKKNQAELIEADNLFEHIEAYTLIRVVKECHRVLIPGGKLWIRVPLLVRDNLGPAFTDPTHVNYFTTETFDYYDYRTTRWKKYGRVYGIPKFERIKQERKERFLIVELKAIK